MCEIFRSIGRGRFWCKYILTKRDNPTGLDECFSVPSTRPPNVPQIMYLFVAVSIFPCSRSPHFSVCLITLLLRCALSIHTIKRASQKVTPNVNKSNNNNSERNVLSHRLRSVCANQQRSQQSAADETVCMQNEWEKQRRPSCDHSRLFVERHFNFGSHVFLADLTEKCKWIGDGGGNSEDG